MANGPPNQPFSGIQDLIAKSAQARSQYNAVKTSLNSARGVSETLNAVNSALAYGNWLAGLFNKGLQRPKMPKTPTPTWPPPENTRAKKLNAKTVKPRGTNANTAPVLSNTLNRSKTQSIFDPKTFTANVKDLARTFRYQVRFLGIAQRVKGVVSTDLGITCEQVEFPGRNLEISEPNIYGPSWKMPYGTAYPEISMTFICDSKLKQRTIFDQWMDLINPKTTYDFRYKTDYVIRIEIIQYDELSNATWGIILNEAFPTSVQPLNASWADSNEFQKVQVSMAFTDYEIEALDAEIEPIDIQDVTVNYLTQL